MPTIPGNEPVKGRPDPLGGGHEGQPVLVGSLIGAILLLIAFAIVVQH